MRKVPIIPNTLRYNIAQALLSVLYGRRWHYISPWKQAGVGANVTLWHNGKVLTATRIGNIEYAGYRQSCFGGHLNLEQQETLAQGLLREVEEELGLTLDIARVDTQSPIFIVHEPMRHYIENHDGACISFFYGYKLSDTEVAQISMKSEVADPVWMSLEEIKNHPHMLPHEYTYIDKVFAYFDKS